MLDDVRNKIRPIDELANIAAEIRASGKAIVQAHGTFDLLHLGHVRHLAAARREGDVLVVTVTADGHVNKGPGRPVFPQGLRAEMLAALGSVDYVAINDAPSAEPAISAIRPSVYVKGNDYANAVDDVTGKILAERALVEKNGGRVVYTDDITFSSSHLINRHINIYDPELRNFLERHRQDGSHDKLRSIIKEMEGLRVLLVGDVIVDEYQYVSPMGRSAKENMIATLFRSQELFAGGVIAAANHVASFCREVEVLTSIGDDHAALVRDSLQPNVRLTALPQRGRPTTRKCRFVDASYLRKLFEVYHMDDAPLSGEQEEGFLAELEKRMRDADLVIVTDFGHGLITPRVVDALAASARFLAVNAQTNSANIGFNLITKYPRADYVCIDEPEARLAVANKHADVGEIANVLQSKLIDCQRFIITHGRYGCVTVDRGQPVAHIPAFTKTVVDTVGAGDAFLAITSPMAALGAPMELIGLIGNIAGALKVGIVGHRQSVQKGPLLKYLETLLK